MPKYRLRCCEPRLEGLPVGAISSADIAGRYIGVVSKENSTAYIYSTIGELIVSHNTDSFQAIRIAPDGFHVVYSRRRKIYAFRLKDPIPYWEKSLEKYGRVTALDIARNNSCYIAVGTEKRLLIFSKEGVLENALKLCGGVLCKSKTPTALAWSPGGRLLAVGTDDSKLLLVSREGGILYEIQLNTPVRRIAWSVDGRSIIVGHSGGELALIVLTDKGLVRARRRRLGDRVNAIASSPLGDILVSWRSGVESFIASSSIDLGKTAWLSSIGEYSVKRIGVPEDHPIIVITDYSEAVFTLELDVKREEEKSVQERLKALALARGKTLQGEAAG